MIVSVPLLFILAWLLPLVTDTLYGSPADEDYERAEIDLQMIESRVARLKERSHV